VQILKKLAAALLYFLTLILIAHIAVTECRATGKEVRFPRRKFVNILALSKVLSVHVDTNLSPFLGPEERGLGKGSIHLLELPTSVFIITHTSIVAHKLGPQ